LKENLESAEKSGQRALGPATLQRCCLGGPEKKIACSAKNVIASIRRGRVHVVNKGKSAPLCVTGHVGEFSFAIFLSSSSLAQSKQQWHQRRLAQL